MEEDKEHPRVNFGGERQPVQERHHPKPGGTRHPSPRHHHPSHDDKAADKVQRAPKCLTVQRKAHPERAQESSTTPADDPTDEDHSVHPKLDIGGKKKRSERSWRRK